MKIEHIPKLKQLQVFIPVDWRGKNGSKQKRLTFHFDRLFKIVVQVKLNKVIDSELRQNN